MLYRQSESAVSTITGRLQTSCITKWSRWEGRHHWTSPDPIPLLTASSTTAGCSGPCPVEFPKMEIPQPLWASCSCFLVLCKQDFKWWICQQRSQSQQNSFSLTKHWRKTSHGRFYRNLSLSLALSLADFIERNMCHVEMGNCRRKPCGKDWEKPYGLVEWAELKVQKSCIFNSGCANTLSHCF